MNLDDYGFNKTIETYLTEHNLNNFEIGRIISQHKERYTVITAKGEFDAEITGNIRYTAQSRNDFPAVGDWVALIIYDSGISIIHNILPRFSLIARQAINQYGEIQIIASNIDYALLVQAVDRDYNINRLERYLSICNSSKITPFIILTKTDLIDNTALNEIINNITHRIKDVRIIALSNTTQQGYDTLRQAFIKGKTYCMLGSSGVGKSTLLNNLSGKIIMKTGLISDSTSKGRHISSYRELVVLENGGILIDNPGMREVGIIDNDKGLENTFDYIIQLSEQCKYKDCTHTNEKGCAIIDALNKNILNKDSYNNYLKIEKEKSFFKSTVAEKRKKDKEFGKMIKNYKNELKNNKY